MSKLTPTEADCVEMLHSLLRLGPIVTLEGVRGTGRTTILRALHERLGGTFVGIGHVVRSMEGKHPLAVEEAFASTVLAALRRAQIVFVDDFDVVAAYAESHTYPRQGLLRATMKMLCERARKAGKQMIIAGTLELTRRVLDSAYSAVIKSIDLEDYEVLIREILGPGAEQVDAKAIFKAAPKLNLTALAQSCHLLQQGAAGKPLTTEDFLAYLSSLGLGNNVRLDQVVSTDLNSLRGIETIVQAIETHVALPIENAQLARELRLQPKRGVLLLGPPGTGKTSIGKALAHRLKGRFYLLDGTVIADTSSFYEELTSVFEEAQQHAPSVIFVDDSDALFGKAGSEGICRYFLSQLDGLEGKRAERVCVVMTAMDVGSFPPALIRSGRLELWLEMGLPTDEARGQMLADFLADAPPPITDVNIARLVQDTAGFSGADLRRVVEDAKLLFAYAQERHLDPKRVEHYFAEAIALIASNKAKYEQAICARSHEG